MNQWSDQDRGVSEKEAHECELERLHRGHGSYDADEKSPGVRDQMKHQECGANNAHWESLGESISDLVKPW